MADENNPNVQQGKKITVKLKPLALEKATGEQAVNVNIPAAPAGASASATVKFDKKVVAASEPEMPTAQDLAKQTIKLAPPPRTGLPKPPAPMPSVAPKKATQVVKPVTAEPAAPAAPALKKATQVVKPVETTPSPSAPTVPEAPSAAATQAVKKPGLSLPKTSPAPAAPAPSPSAPTVPEAPSAAATQAVKKPGLSLPKTSPAPAAPAPSPSAPTVPEAPSAAETLKKPGLALPKKPVAPAPEPAPSSAPEPAPSPAPEAAPAVGDSDAKRVQSEGLKPKEGGSGLGLKKVEKVAEEDLPDSLKQDGASATLNAGKKILLKGPADEPGPVFTTIVILAFVILLIGVYVQFFSYAKWMPEMDAHINSLPAPPTGVLSK